MATLKNAVHLLLLYSVDNFFQIYRCLSEIHFGIIKKNCMCCCKKKKIYKHRYFAENTIKFFTTVPLAKLLSFLFKIQLKKNRFYENL